MKYFTNLMAELSWWIIVAVMCGCVVKAQKQFSCTNLTLASSSRSSPYTNVDKRQVGTELRTKTHTHRVKVGFENRQRSGLYFTPILEGKRGLNKLPKTFYFGSGQLLRQRNSFLVFFWTLATAKKQFLLDSLHQLDRSTKLVKYFTNFMAELSWWIIVAGSM